MTNNIILVVMDTARADFVEVQGNDTPMPNLQDIARVGAIFSKTRAAAPWTLPSYGTVISDQYLSVHQAHAVKKTFEYAPTVGQRLSLERYHTVAISNNIWISEEFSLYRRFQGFMSTWKLFKDGVYIGDFAQTRHSRLDQLKGVVGKFRQNPLKNFSNLINGQHFRRHHDDDARRTNHLIKRHLDRCLVVGMVFFFINYPEPHLEYGPPKAIALIYLQTGVLWGYSPKQADGLRHLLDTWVKKQPKIENDQVSISADTKYRLEGLGYLQ